LHLFHLTPAVAMPKKGAFIFSLSAPCTKTKDNCSLSQQISMVCLRAS
jgi:hypothetical protein